MSCSPARVQTLAFNYAVVQPNEADVKYSGGAVAQAVQQASAGSNSVPVLTAVQDGGALTGVALFIDQNQAAMQPPAATESWWFPYWGGGGGCWGGCGRGCAAFPPPLLPTLPCPCCAPAPVLCCIVIWALKGLLCQ